MYHNLVILYVWIPVSSEDSNERNYPLAVSYQTQKEWMPSEMDDAEKRRLLIGLKADKASEVASTLREIRQNPTGNSHIIKTIDELLSDKRVTITDIQPMIYYGELSWLAGLTLTYEYAKIGRDDNVVVPSTFEPLSANELHDIADDSDFYEANGKTQNLILVLDKKHKINCLEKTFWTKHAVFELKRRKII